MEQAEEYWRAAEARSFSRYLQRDIRGAIEVLGEYVETDSSSPFGARALGNRAEFLLEIGKASEAERDLRRALELEGSPTYTRYTLEFALGALLEGEGATDATVEAYCKALRTALAEGNTVSAGVVLRLARLATNNPMPTEIQAIIGESLKRSWGILGIPGTPDLATPEQTAELLLREASRVR
ncbi:MAG: hypothetical protein SF066_11930 [Thermoanaerobaculia bacterium]|nr:hypothetical protein [Thermoanaerobaculia bacterium]